MIFLLELPSKLFIKFSFPHTRHFWYLSMLILRPKASFKFPVHRMMTLSQRTASSAQLEQQQQQEESFFHYNSGRWLYNEKERECPPQNVSSLKLIMNIIISELTARYLKFKVDALQRVAAKAVGAKRCISMIKTNEGKFWHVKKYSCQNLSNLFKNSYKRLF